MKIVIPITIKQPAAIVFDQIADARNEAKWNSTLTDYRLVSSGPIGQGAMFIYKNRGNEFASTLAVYDRPNSLTFDIHGKPMDIYATVNFKAKDATTTDLVATYILTPKGAMKIMMLIFGPFLSKAFAKEFQNFKKFSEAQ